MTLVQRPDTPGAHCEAAGGRAAGDAERTALEVRSVVKRFGSTEVLRGLSLRVRVGERMALIGPNGAGKSTLFNVICAATPCDAGDVLLHGRSIARLPTHRIYRLGLARSFQISQLFTRLSVFDNLRCALLQSMGVGYSCWQLLSGLRGVNAQAHEWMARLRLDQRHAEPAMNLSYAEQRALELGMTLAGGAQVVLLDEPTAGMSQSETTRFVALLREVTAGRTLLVVEHDMNVVFELADRVAVLVQGQVVAVDTPQALRANPQAREAYLGDDAPAPRRPADGQLTRHDLTGSPSC